MQTFHPHALGGGGTTGLGYDGLPLSLAVEFDTYPDGHGSADVSGGGGGPDPGENHVSVHIAAPPLSHCASTGENSTASQSSSSSSSADGRNSASHTHSLGHAPFSRLPDLTGSIHAVRIVYDPVFDPQLVGHPSFVSEGQGTGHAAAAGMVAQLLPCHRDADDDSLSASNSTSGSNSSSSSRGDSATTGSDDWRPETNSPPSQHQSASSRGGPVGTLSVFIDDLTANPILIVPLSLDGPLRLGDSHGRAWVGFTAATGAGAEEGVWQTHDILAWSLVSDRAGDPVRRPR